MCILINKFFPEFKVTSLNSKKFDVSIQAYEWESGLVLVIAVFIDNFRIDWIFKPFLVALPLSNAQLLLFFKDTLKVTK